METWKTAVHSWQLFQQIPTCLFHACLPAIKGTKVRELSLSEMFFYAEGVVVQGCVCLCVFVSSITKVQFGATKSVNRKSTWRSKTCTGKKLGTRRHKMQDESSSNGWVQAANGQEVNAGKVPFWSCMCVSHTHTHTYSRRWTVGQLIHVHLMLLPLFICCFIAAAPGQFMCVCVWQSVVLGAAPGSRATCLLPLTEPLSSVSLSPCSVSFFRVWPTAVCQGAAFYVQMICTPASAFDFFSFIVSLSLFYRTARHIHSAKHNRAADKQDSASSDWTPFNHLQSW